MLKYEPFPRDAIADPRSGPSTHLDDQEMREMLHRSLTDLEPAVQTIIARRFGITGDARSCAALSAELKWPEVRVRRLLRRGLARLARQLRDFCP